MKLSILICTLESRRSVFERLVSDLRLQCPQDEVEILSKCDNGRMARGAKRQQLLEEATGDFIVFKDDDDLCPKDYYQTIRPHLIDGVDCIGHHFDCYGYVRGRPHQLERASVSSKYRTWAENKDGFRYVRYTHHLVPVRREHALAAGFDVSVDQGEDFGYSMRLLKSNLLKNEVFIPKTLYTIVHNPTKRRGQ